jgi:hypothetical protein
VEADGKVYTTDVIVIVVAVDVLDDGEQKRREERERKENKGNDLLRSFHLFSSRGIVSG